MFSSINDDFFFNFQMVLDFVYKYGILLVKNAFAVSSHHISVTVTSFWCVLTWQTVVHWTMYQTGLNWHKRRDLDALKSHWLFWWEIKWTKIVNGRWGKSWREFNEWMNECVFIYCTYHIVSQGGLQFYLSEIGRQLVKAPLAAAISSCLISLTHPTHEMCNETTDRPQHRELRALLFSMSVWVL